MIEIEVQNETHQTQERIRFAAVPRIGEGLRLREPDGIWASYDVLDVWYQKAEYGDIWMPYLHVCMTPGERAETEGRGAANGYDQDANAFDTAGAFDTPNGFDDAGEYDEQVHARIHAPISANGKRTALAGEFEPSKI